MVYCQAESFMLLMPDSRLSIVPFEGGESRILTCNMNSMNSWHAWSPNGKWLVFSSKGLSPYTDMFLTRIDEKGNSSVPVLVEKARVEHRVINYPEFANRNPEDVFDMDYDYVELAHINKALKKGDSEKAKRLFFQLENQHPFLFSEDCLALSGMLKKMGLQADARKYEELSKHTENSEIFKHQ